MIGSVKHKAMCLYKNILLIDDDGDDVFFFTSALSEVNNKVKVTIAGNGLEALKLLNSMDYHPELIFLDINMPVMGGIEFLEVIKRNEMLSSIPVVMLSTSKAQANDCFSLGARAYFVKPYQHEGFVALLQNVLITDFALNSRVQFSHCIIPKDTRQNHNTQNR